MAKKSIHVYNQFFTEEKWLKVNKYNKDAMEDFLLELKAQKKSDKTIYQYKSDLRIFFIWILDTYDNCPIYKLKKKQLRNFVLEMSDKGMSSNRVNRMKSVVSSFFTYLEDDDDYEEIEMNYMSKVKSVQKKLVREIVFLTNEQVEIIYDELMKRENYRDALLISLSFESLARRNEIYQIKKDWITLDSNMTKGKVTGKRGKVFHLFYFDKTKEAYSKYMEQRTDDNEDLWVDKNGNTISYENLYDRIVECRKILEEKTGEYLEFNNHSFRHSGAEAYKRGENWACKGKEFSLDELQALMNHSDISTTKSYLKENDTEIILNAFGINEN